MSTSEIQNELRQFIVEQFPVLNGQELQSSDSLLETGVVDSLGILEIVTFIERKFEIVLTDDEMVAEHFNSIDSLSKLVESHNPGGE